MTTVTRIGLPAALVVAALAAVLLAAAPRRAASPPRDRAHARFQHRQTPFGGPAFATVPDVLDEPLHSASRTLRRSRFHLRASSRIVPRAIPGEVLAMRPAPGSLVPAETTIVLVVARRRPAAPGPP